MAAADPVSGAGRLALHVHCSFSRQRMRLPETTNNCPPAIKTADFINRQKKNCSTLTIMATGSSARLSHNKVRIYAP